MYKLQVTNNLTFNQATAALASNLDLDWIIQGSEILLQHH